MRSSASGSVVYSSRRKPLNSEPVDFRTTRSSTPAATSERSRVTSTRAVRTSPPRRTKAWSWPCPSTSMRSHACSWTCDERTVRRRRRLEQPGAEGERVVLGRADAVLLRVGERGVLLRVGGQHVRLVAVGVRRREVAAQRRGHGEVADLVARGVAHDPHHARLRLAVAVRSQHDAHPVSLPLPAARCASVARARVSSPVASSTSAAVNAPQSSPRSRKSASARAVAGSSRTPDSRCPT